MTSLPQGWHGIPVATKNSKVSAYNAVSQVTATIRRKWNSPMSTEMPKSKLPAYKTSNLRSQRQSLCNGLDATTTSVRQNELPPKKDSLPKPAPSKDLLLEIGKLKKELATIKTENSILKVKVRRVDDENLLKSRHLEKLQNEVKELQKNDSSISKKGKESELLLLRQKCLRLEGALKEKDPALRKRIDMSMKTNGNCSLDDSFLKEVSMSEDSKTDKTNDTKLSGRSSLTGQSSFSRSSLSGKSQLTKLTDIIHKLEKENQDLQLQVKEKGEEIRLLKRHIRSQTYVKSPNVSHTPLKSSENIKFSPVPEEEKPKLNVVKQNMTTIKKRPPLVQTKKTVASTGAKVPARRTLSSENSTDSSSMAPKQRGTSAKSTTVRRSFDRKSLSKSPNDENLSDSKKKGNENDSQNKAKAVPRKKISTEKNVLGNNRRSTGSFDESATESKIKLNETFSKISNHSPNSTFVLTPSSDKALANNIDFKAQMMRESMAAKKIQRSWRSYNKKVGLKCNPDLSKSLTFIITSLKHHKMRHDKLKLLLRRRNLPVRPKINLDPKTSEAVLATSKKIWESQ